jgi:uncharacterized protein
MNRFFIYGGLTVLIAYAGICLAVYLGQRSLIYFPTKATQPGSGGNQILQVNGASLQISVRITEGPNALIYFGGNAEEVTSSLPTLASAFPNHSLYLMHYRSYDGSTGEPTETNLHADAKALYDFVRAKHSDIVVIGRSLGSGVAIQLAAKNEVERLVLVTPYDSILNIAKQTFPWLPVGLLLKDKFESIKYAPNIKAPTMIIMAEDDEVIPRANTQALFQSFLPGTAKIEIIPHTGHNTVSQSVEYARMLQGTP